METKTTHFDYAEEAESAQRGGAWKQAAKLWKRAAEELRAATGPSIKFTEDQHHLHTKYVNSQYAAKKRGANCWKVF